MSFKKFVAGFDVHGDQQCKKTNEVFFKFVDQWKPDYRIAGGDIFDFRPLRGKATTEERRESVMADRNDGMEWLARFEPTHYLLGNHCLAAKTEVLTEVGWVRIDSLPAKLKLAQVSSSRVLSYADPLGYIKTPVQTSMIQIKGAFTHQVVTLEHDVLVDGMKVKAKELLDKKIKSSSIWRSANWDQPANWVEDPDWIRLITWFVTDGTFVDESIKCPWKTKARIQWKLSYPHKIEKLKCLLDKMSIPYTLKLATKGGVNKLQPFRFCVYGDWARKILSYVSKKKEFPRKWIGLGRESLDVFIQTLSETDGSFHDASVSWITTSKNDADIVSHWCMLRGVDFRSSPPREKKSGFSNGKPQYNCAIRFREVLQDCSLLDVTEIPYGDHAYCVTMPQGTIVTRYAGCPAITGNCNRLWLTAAKNDGVLSDFCQQGINEIEDLCKSLKCRIYPYHKRHGILKLGHLKVIHGFACGVYAARQTALVYGSCLFGHTHSIDEHSIPGLERRVARACGCLCNLDLEYSSTNPSTLRQANGWAYGIIDDRTGAYHVWQSECIGGKWILPSDITEYRT
jgi:hypothetical protein